MKRVTLDELQAAVSHALPASSRPADALEAGLAADSVRALIDWELPPIVDVSEACSVRAGRVRAIRMDLLSGVNSLKKPVVAGLLVLAATKRKFVAQRVECLVDAGNMNSAFALQYYCERFGVRGHYVMSRYFPPELLALVQGGALTVELAPPAPHLSIEREFYSHLLNRLRDRAFRRHKAWLWHAKYSGRVMRVLGTELRGSLPEVPDVIVTSVGSGASLELLRACAAAATRPTVVVVEHEASPILARLGIPASPPTTLGSPQALDHDFHESHIPRNPQPVLGPHYEEVNPFLDPATTSAISRVQQYSEGQWRAWSQHLRLMGLPVGNSSSAHLLVAAQLARCGADVLTVIAEPLRDYYLEHFWLDLGRRGPRREEFKVA